MQSDHGPAQIADRILAGARTTVLTGAGVSAASGVPTFRGADGLWRRHRPEALATPEAFRRDPGLVWEWYDWRRQIVAACTPNRAHAVLAAWTRRDAEMSLITQNVDGLHERAGAERVIRFHGSLWEVGCWERCPGSPTRWPDHTVPFATLPPTCRHCDGLLRPGVVWFGEGIDPTVLSQSDEATACELFLTIGTSSVVYPAAGLVEQARRRGAFTVEINPDETPASDHVDLVLRGTAEAILDAIERLIVPR
jgi:NAD-dependent deacetylase